MKAMHEQHQREMEDSAADTKKKCEHKHALVISLILVKHLEIKQTL